LHGAVQPSGDTIRRMATRVRVAVLGTLERLRAHAGWTAENEAYALCGAIGTCSEWVHPAESLRSRLGELGRADDASPLLTISCAIYQTEWSVTRPDFDEAFAQTDVLVRAYPVPSARILLHYVAGRELYLSSPTDPRLGSIFSTGLENARAIPHHPLLAFFEVAARDHDPAQERVSVDDRIDFARHTARLSPISSLSSLPMWAEKLAVAGHFTHSAILLGAFRRQVREGRARAAWLDLAIHAVAAERNHPHEAAFGAALDMTGAAQYLKDHLDLLRSVLERDDSHPWRASDH
jgi:hypothetical protein